MLLETKKHLNRYSLFSSRQDATGCLHSSRRPCQLAPVILPLKHISLHPVSCSIPARACPSHHHSRLNTAPASGLVSQCPLPPSHSHSLSSQQPGRHFKSAKLLHLLQSAQNTNPVSWFPPRPWPIGSVFWPALQGPPLPQCLPLCFGFWLLLIAVYLPTYIYIYICIYIYTYIFFLAAPYGLQDLSSLTRAHGSESTKS